MNWMLMPYKRYADFSGRARRMEYWMFRLFEFAVVVIWFVAMSIIGATFGSSEGGGGGGAGDIVAGLSGLLLFAFVLGSIIPSLAVTVRRLHDTGRSGWMMLMALVPLVGPIVLLVFLFSDGTRGPNPYGDDPKATGEHAADVFS